MSIPAALAALPGATADAGTGPAEEATLDGLFDDGALLDDAAVLEAAGQLLGRGQVDAAVADDLAERVARVLARHRELVTGPHRDLVGPLLVPAGAAAALRAALKTTDLGLRVQLVATSPADAPAELRTARAHLLDEDRIELVGVRLPLPVSAAETASSGGAATGDRGSTGDSAPEAARAAHDLLAALDSSAPAWITLPPGPVGAAALAVLAADGAENVTLDVRQGGVETLAALVRDLVDRDLSFRVAGADGLRRTSVPGVLNVLCATRAALNGAEPAELAAVLATDAIGPLASAVRRMSAADAAVTRAFCVGAAVPDVGVALADLTGLGLLVD